MARLSPPGVGFLGWVGGWGVGGVGWVECWGCWVLGVGWGVRKKTGWTLELTIWLAESR